MPFPQRIRDIPAEATSVSPLAYIVIDSPTDGTQKVKSSYLLSNMAGLLDSKSYVAKLTETTFSVEAGTAFIRKADLSLHEVSWSSIASVDITALNGGVLNPGELRWIVYQWNVGETAIELKLLPLLPTKLEDLDQIVLIGRLWNTAGTLFVSNRHIRLSNDRAIATAGISWSNPSLNVRNSVVVSPATNTAYLKISAGELARFPVVSNLATRLHTFEYEGLTQLNDIWVHLKNASIYTNVTNCTATNLLNYWDSGAGTWTVGTVGKYYVHRLGLYAGSNEKVWFPGQIEYGSMAVAEVAKDSEIISLSPWANDAAQIAPIAYIIARKGETEFTVAGANCKILPWKNR